MNGSKHPYILTGLVRCATCGGSLVGKSAHGRTQKVAYYEHGWSTKRNSTLTEKIFQCEPTRVLGNRLEPLVLDKVRLLLCSKEFAKELLNEATLAFEKGSPRKQIDRLKSAIYGYNSQLEAVAERLSQLPKSVNAKPFFTQMEKIEKQKRDCEDQIHEVQMRGEVLDKPIELTDYRSFLNQIREVFNKTDNKEIQARMIKWIVSKIEVGPDFVRLHYRIGENIAQKTLSFAEASDFSEICSSVSSKSLTCGAPEPKLVEHLSYSKSVYRRFQEKPKVEKLYSMQWRRETLDLAELATKRYIEGWKLPDLCVHFGRGENTVQWAYLMLKRQGFRHKQITEDLRNKLVKAVAVTEKGKKCLN